MKRKGCKNVNDRLKGLVLTIKSLNPEWSANQILRHLKRTANGKSVLPKLRTIQSILAKPENKSKIASYEILYGPWNMGMLDTYPVPVEALPIIIEVQKWADGWMKLKEHMSQQELNQNQWLEWNHFDISIRQVHWIARLYTLVNWQKATKNKKAKEWAVNFLWTWSKAYMYQELICWLAGKTPDTSNLDKALRDGWGAKIMGAYYLLFPKDGKWPEMAGISVYYRDDSIIDVIKREKGGEK